MKTARFAAAVTVCVAWLLASAGGSATAAGSSTTGAPEYGSPIRIGRLGFDPPSGLSTDAAGDLFMVDGFFTGHDRILLKRHTPDGLGPVRVLPFTFPADSVMASVAVDRYGDVIATDGSGAVMLPADPSAAGGYGPQVTLKPAGLPANSVVSQVATDAAGDVVLGAEDFGGGPDTIVEFPRSADGYGAQEILPCDQFQELVGLAVDPAGDVVIGEPDSVVVLPKTDGGVGSPVVTPVSREVTAMASDAGGDLYLTEATSGGAHAYVLDELRPFADTYLTDPVQVLDHIAPKMVVRGVAITADDLYVSMYDDNGSRINDYARTGTSLAYPTSVHVSGLSAPAGVATDKAGDVFAADAARHRVVEFPASGQPFNLPFTGLSYPSDVTVDPAGDVFVIDTTDGTENPPLDGRLLELPKTSTGYGPQVTVFDTGPDGAGLHGLTTDPEGDVFMGSEDGSVGPVGITEFSPAGGVYAARSTIAVPTANYILALASDASGNLFVSAASGSQSSTPQNCPYASCSILEFLSTGSGYGAPITVATGLDPDALAVDGGDRVFAFSSSSPGTAGVEQVVVMTKRPTKWSRPAAVPSLVLASPEGLAAAPDGTLYVAGTDVEADASILELPVLNS